MKIPCAVYRGGTSKPILLLEKDLPRDPHERDRLILSLFGSPDARQIDGLGGADPLTSKVALIGPPTNPDADVDYTFGYVGITRSVIDYRGNCGNTLAAVGPFALLRGLVEANAPRAKIRIHNTNTKKITVAEFPVRSDQFDCEGDFRIDGVPGTGSRVLLDFLDCAGSVTGKLLPTGNPADELDFPSIGTLRVSIVDAANPFIFVRATDLDLHGDEVLDELEGNRAFLDNCEIIRSVAAEILNIAPRSKATEESPGVPKVAVVAPPRSYAIPFGAVHAENIGITARMTALQRLHKAYAVTGAVCLGVAAKVPGTVVHELTQEAPSHDGPTVRIGHPSGVIEVDVCVDDLEGRLTVTRAAVGRTARLLMDGYAYLPSGA